MKNSWTIVFLWCVLLVFETQANGYKDDAYEKLNKILWLVNNEELSETKYNKLFPLVQESVNAIISTSKEHKYRNNEFPSFNLLVQKFGLTLDKLKNKLFYNVKGTDDYWSLLALSVLEDSNAKKIVVGHILSTTLKKNKFAYVKLLAYYSSDARNTQQILDLIKKDEWYPPLINLISFISENLTSHKTKWQKYLLWEELKKINSELLCDKYNNKINNLDNPALYDSNTNLMTQLTDFDKNYLKSKNIDLKLIDGVWKNTKLFKYIIKLSNEKNSLIMIDGLDRIDRFDSLQPFENKLYDLFTIGNRHFFINSFGSFHIHKYIYELVWDYDNSKYKLSRRFELGQFYKELLIKDNYIFIVGENWKYKINKGNGVIEAATLCGKNVTINQAL